MPLILIFSTIGFSTTRIDNIPLKILYLNFENSLYQIIFK